MVCNIQIEWLRDFVQQITAPGKPWGVERVIHWLCGLGLPPAAVSDMPFIRLWYGIENSNDPEVTGQVFSENLALCADNLFTNFLPQRSDVLVQLEMRPGDAIANLFSLLVRLDQPEILSLVVRKFVTLWERCRREQGCNRVWLDCVECEPVRQRILAAAIVNQESDEWVSDWALLVKQQGDQSRFRTGCPADGIEGLLRSPTVNEETFSTICESIAVFSNLEDRPDHRSLIIDWLETFRKRYVTQIPEFDRNLFRKAQASWSRWSFEDCFLQPVLPTRMRDTYDFSTPAEISHEDAIPAVLAIVALYPKHERLPRDQAPALDLTVSMRKLRRRGINSIVIRALDPLSGVGPIRLLCDRNTLDVLLELSQEQRLSDVFQGEFLRLVDVTPPYKTKCELLQELFDTERFDDAISCANELLQDNPGNGIALNGKGAALIAQYRLLHRGSGKNEKLAEALCCFRLAIEFFPEDSYGWANLGIGYFERGVTRLALKFLSKAIRLNIFYDFPWYNVGIVWRELEDYDESFVAFEIAGYLGNEDAFSAQQAVDAVRKTRKPR